MIYLILIERLLPIPQPVIFFRSLITIQRSCLGQVKNQLVAVDHINSIDLPPGVLLLLLVNLINHFLHLMPVFYTSEKSRRYRYFLGSLLSWLTGSLQILISSHDPTANDCLLGE